MEKNHFDQNDRDLIIKIDTKLERAIQDIKELKDTVNSRENTFVTKEESSHFVRSEDFEPIRKLVYGVISLMLTAIVGSLMYLVIK